MLTDSSYVIYKSGTRIKAINGTTGIIDFSGYDAATVIQSAINALTSGGKIFIKAGTYLINSTIEIPYPHTVEGEGRGATCLKVNTNGIDLINITFNTFSLVGYQGINLKNLWLEGNNLGHYGIKFGDGGAQVISSEQNLFENLTIRKFTDFAIYENSSWGNVYINCRIIVNGGENVDKGGLCLMGPNGPTFIGCSFDWCGTGIIARGGVNASFINPIIQGNFHYGIRAYATPAEGLYPGPISIINPYFENNNQSGAANGRDLFIDGTGCNRWTITGGRCTGTANIEYSLYMSGGGHVITNYLNNRPVKILSASSTIINTQIDPSSFPLNTGTKVIGYGYSDSGTMIANGTGSQTQFKIKHSLLIPPSVVTLESKSIDATGQKYWNSDSLYIYVNFITPPPLGNNNIILSWKAEV